MTAKRLSRWQPNFEVLEDRQLMAAAITASLSNGLLRIDGTESNDIINVRRINNMMSVDGVKISVNGSKVNSVSAGSVSKILVNGFGGHDHISLNSGAVSGQQAITAKASLYGGAGNDTLIGGNGSDHLSGWTGNDKIWGLVGNDTLYGGEHNDSLVGGGNNDRLYGYTGTDTLRGESGNDYLKGGAGKDFVYGGAGTDTFRRSLFVPGFSLGDDNQDDKADIPVEVSGGFLTDHTSSDSPWDIDQAATPTCAFLAGLAGIASWTGSSNDLVKAIRYDGASDTYGIRLKIDGSWKTYWVNGDWSEGKDPSGALWVTLYQKAYLKAMGVSYQYADGSFKPSSAWVSSTGKNFKSAGVAMTALSGLASTWIGNGSMSSSTMRSQLAGSNPWVLVACTNNTVSNSKVVGDHCYWVRSVDSSGNVTLYNPWGHDRNGPSVDGKDDGLIKLSWSEYKASFSGYYKN